MNLARRLLPAAPLVVIVALLAVGAAAGALAGTALVIMVGVIIGVATNRRIGRSERRAWIVTLVAAAWFLASTLQPDSHDSRTTAVGIALFAVAAVLARWLSIGFMSPEHSDVDGTPTHEQRSRHSSP